VWGGAMITDLAPYRECLHGLDLTDAQKLDLVNALWAIAENIIDNHLGLNQLTLNTKEQKNDIDSAGANATLNTELTTG
jgi:hypothetical protein